jgi:hypothetical protein
VSAVQRISAYRGQSRPPSDTWTRAGLQAMPAKRSEYTMKECLAGEIMDAANNTGIRCIKA